VAGSRKIASASSIFEFGILLYSVQSGPDEVTMN
jgi:hypothetical protein